MAAWQFYMFSKLTCTSCSDQNLTCGSGWPLAPFFLPNGKYIAKRITAFDYPVVVSLMWLEWCKFFFFSGLQFFFSNGIPIAEAKFAFDFFPCWCLECFRSSCARLVWIRTFRADQNGLLLLFFFSTATLNPQNNICIRLLCWCHWFAIFILERQFLFLNGKPSAKITFAFDYSIRVSGLQIIFLNGKLRAEKTFVFDYSVGVSGCIFFS
jgi:hypothetical protein